MLGISSSSQRAHFVSKAEDSGQASVRTIAHDPRTLSPASGAWNHVGESTQPYSRELGQRQPASLRKSNSSFKEYKHLQRLIVGPHWWLRAGLGVPPWVHLGRVSSWAMPHTAKRANWASPIPLSQQWGSPERKRKEGKKKNPGKTFGRTSGGTLYSWRGNSETPRTS